MWDLLLILFSSFVDFLFMTETAADMKSRSRRKRPTSVVEKTAVVGSSSTTNRMQRHSQFSLRELLIFTTACAMFWAFLRLVSSQEVYGFCVALSLAGSLCLGFSMLSVRSGHIGLRSKISLAAASLLLVLTLWLACLSRLGL